ncbi:lysozyme [Dysgonomonas alginatilytica]|uniref:Lysozyme n=1 Tax=Dysgonomonas alginatilytica TaxID=1605892 RepID=A0A2V3PUN1_9BACT|nr:GH25 family lysozyme [Dysgonomonas alginatilytica]PXV63152.1 lysozyme [Dysgonomonas alginatilytica]
MGKKSKKKNKKNKLKSITIVSTLIILLLALAYHFYKKSVTADTFKESSKYQVKGIDVSHHNPILDWAEVKRQNITFTYLKATEGITHDDRNYIYNYKLTKENNIKTGSYHFYNFGVSGREQAKHFIRVAKCKSGDLIPAIDVEHSPANPYSKDPSFVKNVIKELSVMENELYEYYGFHPVIYTNIDCYKLYISDSFPNNPIWISSLNKEPNDDIRNWVIWQFTHKGELDGIVGDLDLNYFRYSFDDLRQLQFP